jgi:hypothetical protein
MGDCTESSGRLAILLADNVGGGTGHQPGLAARISRVSILGGASFELQEGGELPGIEVLDDAENVAASHIL